MFRRPDGFACKRIEAPGGQIKTAFNGACRRAGIIDFSPHGCQHTWATWHYAANRDIIALTKLGGWKSEKMVLRYAHVNVSHLASSISMLPSLEIKNQLVRQNNALDSETKVGTAQLSSIKDIDKFFLVLVKKGDELTGHGISFDENDLPGTPIKKTEDSPPPEPTTQKEYAEFRDVFEGYVSVMRTYRDFIALTLSLVPTISMSIAERRVSEFAKSKGSPRLDLSNDTRTVFELKIDSLREFTVYNDEIQSALAGARVLPEVMIIGLVSAYDSFLTQLLRVVFKKNPKLILASEKLIKYSELIEYSTIDEARDALIDREIESILRESHHQQFESLQKIFSMTLKDGLDIWPKFIELCERRNLLTHTGGIVSKQYLSNCSQHKYDVGGISIGQRLKVDSRYFEEAVHVVSEIGIKLSYVVWRKFSKRHEKEADTAVNEACYQLIVRRQYKTAEAILAFSSEVVKKHKGSDRTRRMMIINLANALRLQDKTPSAKKLLDLEDWSSVDDEITVSLAAVRGDAVQVASLMRKIGKKSHPNIEDYRTWPVFRGMRDTPEFASAFQEVFDEPVRTTKIIDSKPPAGKTGKRPPLH